MRPLLGLDSTFATTGAVVIFDAQLLAPVLPHSPPILKPLTLVLPIPLYPLTGDGSLTRPQKATLETGALFTPPLFLLRCTPVYVLDTRG